MLYVSRPSKYNVLQLVVNLQQLQAVIGSIVNYL